MIVVAAFFLQICEPERRVNEPFEANILLATYFSFLADDVTAFKKHSAASNYSNILSRLDKMMTHSNTSVDISLNDTVSKLHACMTTCMQFSYVTVCINACCNSNFA